MLRTLAVPALSLIALMWVFNSSRCTSADAPAPSKEKIDFTGKVIAITIKDEKNGVYLESVQLKQLGGRTFLVGTFAKRPDDDFPDMIYWVPVDQIQVMIEFKTMDEAHKAYKSRTDRDR